MPIVSPAAEIIAIPVELMRSVAVTAPPRSKVRVEAAVPPKVVAPVTARVLVKPSAMVKTDPAARVSEPPRVLVVAMAFWPTARVAPLKTVAAVAPPRLPLGPSSNFPVATEVTPVWVLVAFRVRVPVPSDLLKTPVPKLSALLSTTSPPPPTTRPKFDPVMVLLMVRMPLSELMRD